MTVELRYKWNKEYKRKPQMIKDIEDSTEVDRDKKLRGKCSMNRTIIDTDVDNFPKNCLQKAN